MAVVDMSLDKLWQYRGISPKPADFDEFWENALDQMKGIDPCVTITPSDFSTSFADCFDMYFTGTGGARIYAKLLKPKNINGKCPAVLNFHGYTGSSGDWFDKLPYAANGFIVASLDCRGQGGKSEDTGGVKGNTQKGHIIRGLNDCAENLLYRHIFLDTAELASIVMGMEDVDQSRVAAMGASQGGGLAVACAALEPKIAAVVSVYPFLSDYKRFWEMDLETEAYSELKDFFRRFDPLHEKEDELFRRLGYIDVQNLAPRIKGKVLMAASIRDDVCPPSTQFAVYNKIESEKNIAVYPDFSHESLPGFSDRAFQFLCSM